jgi:hypothetical protein
LAPELFALIAPHLEEASERVGVARETPARVRHGLLATGAVALIVVTVLFLRSDESLPAVPPIVTACNGDEVLCDRPFDQVVLPGAHNAMASADVPGWMFPNHDHGIPTQLQKGIRAFMLDVYGGTPVEGRIKTDLTDEEARRKFDEAIARSALRPSCPSSARSVTSWWRTRERSW